MTEQRRRVLVIDDDPTGTQAVSGVRVTLRPDRAAFAEFFDSPATALFALSNSRALTRAGAEELIGRIAADLHAAADGRPYELLLRGDSTLRGHVFAEIDAVDPTAVVLFVPAFPPGGRVTVGGVHYFRRGGESVPVAETEFARDPVFGYRSSRLTDWVGEVTGGRRKATWVPPDGVRQALTDAADGEVVVPDAETDDDLRTILAGYRAALADGARVVVRCAASLAALAAGTEGRRVDRIPVPAPGRVLVVCGSVTSASTAQLHQLGPLWSQRVQLPDGAAAVSGLAELVRQRIAEHGRALLATGRRRTAVDPTELMDALVAVAAEVVDEVDVVVAKGGITSARVAAQACRAAAAEVVGQPLPGVPLWRLDSGLPYVVVPGNVGTDSTLADLLDRLEVTDHG